MRSDGQSTQELQMYYANFRLTYTGVDTVHTELCPLCRNPTMLLHTGSQETAIISVAASRLLRRCNVMSAQL